MNTEKVYILEDRGILYINGPDSEKFLQNLISNDILFVTSTDVVKGIEQKLFLPTAKQFKVSKEISNEKINIIDETISSDDEIDNISITKDDPQNKSDIIKRKINERRRKDDRRAKERRHDIKRRELSKGSFKGNDNRIINDRRSSTDQRENTSRRESLDRRFISSDLKQTPQTSIHSKGKKVNSIKFKNLLLKLKI